MEDSEASTDGYVEVAPKPIVQLEQDVINKIAAAEVSYISPYPQCIIENTLQHDPFLTIADHPSSLQRNQRAARKLSRRRLDQYQNQHQGRRVKIDPNCRQRPRYQQG